ncbi:hypothetical protein MYCTH_39658 [Thermothelomyces thermophilus ATCC 42464]|uniref:BTB domain-containing protein n=1 Tax=Thermothelomyces thermophilus (strain ATCC 42464 / BCRC 31852 / DSM 1799) TaxID=573729 RepID=G2Q1K6_THET4|nr:uncharacterized protein MYCTH_39658 [Thermothelomyces thermophilus ATCC 42464]AEO54997.1 hypothetical protein MYCTH_39658 [Thermothelomyces thermophilus ATCC 42464]
MARNFDFLAQLLDSGDFSDLAFCCRGEAFKVHKAVVCTQSAPIKAAVLGGFKEGETGSINMDHFHPSIVRRLVQFLYTGKYDDLEDNSVSSTRNGRTETAGTQECSDPPPLASPMPKADAIPVLLGHIRMNSIGDYYQVENLVFLANGKIDQLLRDHSKDSSLVESLPAAIEEAVQSTGDKKLLKVLAVAVADNISALVDMDTFRNLSALSDFAFHVIQDCAQKPRALTTELRAAQRELDGSKAQIEVFKDHEERFLRLLNLLNNTSQCRHCRTEFSCIIDAEGYILRCARCSTRHY